MIMRLDEFPTTHVRVGYGELGLRGSLGYENKTVTVRGRVQVSGGKFVGSGDHGQMLKREATHGN